MNSLVLNPGSSTLKFGWFDISDPKIGSNMKVLASGSVASIGGEHSELKFSTATRKDPVIETIKAKTAAEATEQVIRRLRIDEHQNDKVTPRIEAVGFRVVHGGSLYLEPTRVSTSVLKDLQALSDLAPLHIPADVAELEQVGRLLPDIPLVAVFDTAFHKTLPPVAYTYALPEELSDRYGLRRYGFHGISHAYVSARLIEHLGAGILGTQVITCHLGSGASVCAVRDGQSMDISMGLTPLEGLVMGTRSGDVDAGLVLYLIRAAGMPSDTVDKLLNNKSGLLGISNLSPDVRDLEEAARNGNKRAELALDIFAYHASKYIAAFTAVLEGLDAIAFTGGIGEHSASMRRRICHRLKFFGLELDDELNEAATANSDTRISSDSSPIQIWVISTDEERQIALSTFNLLRG